MVSKQTQAAAPGHAKWLGNPWLGNADPLGAMPTNGNFFFFFKKKKKKKKKKKAKAALARMRQLGAADIGEMLAAIFDLHERLERPERLAAQDQAGTQSADRDAGD